MQSCRPPARSLAAAPALLSLLWLGCAGGGGASTGAPGAAADTGLVELDCTMGELDGDGTFVPAESNGAMELWLGFQGFLFLTPHVRAPGAEEGVYFSALYSVTVEGEEPEGGAQTGVPLSDGLSSELRLYLTAHELGWYVDRPAEIAIRLETPAQTCVTQLDLRLVDDDPCIHTDAEPDCPDDTGEAR
jgi:hypothetical protein